MKLNYCPECGAKLAKDSATKYVCDNKHTYWNNSKAAVAIILIKDGQALYSKRAFEPKKGKYDFPGGFVDNGENVFEAAKRELSEETGIQTDELTVIDSTYQEYEENVSVCDMIFVSQQWQGTPKPADDVASLEWKPVDFIDSDEFAWDYSGLSTKLKEYIGK